MAAKYLVVLFTVGLREIKPCIQHVFYAILSQVTRSQPLLDAQSVPNQGPEFADPQRGAHTYPRAGVWRMDVRPVTQHLPRCDVVDGHHGLVTAPAVGDCRSAREERTMGGQHPGGTGTQPHEHVLGWQRRGQGGGGGCQGHFEERGAG